MEMYLSLPLIKIAAINIERLIHNHPLLSLPENTMIGSLIKHITAKARIPLSPVYANYGLLPPIKGFKKKRERNMAKGEKALETFEKFILGETI